LIIDKQQNRNGGS